MPAGLDAATVVNASVLLETGIVRRVRDGVRLLGSGSLSVPMTFEVVGASRSAITAVERAGGSVRLLSSGKSDEGTSSAETPEESAEA